jgi:hypothetical protein
MGGKRTGTDRPLGQRGRQNGGACVLLSRWGVGLCGVSFGDLSLWGAGVWGVGVWGVSFWGLSVWGALVCMPLRRDRLALCIAGFPGRFTLTGVLSCVAMADGIAYVFLARVQLRVAGSQLFLGRNRAFVIGSGGRWHAIKIQA